MDRFLTRRRLVQTGAAAGVLTLTGAAGAMPSAVAKQDAPLAADQTLRIVSRALPTRIGPQLGNLREMLGNTFMPAFVTDKEAQLQPGVCNDWSVSADGLVYTITIDPAAMFSDGSPVTAEDIAFTYNYLTQPATESWAPPYVTLMIAGYADVLSGAAEEMSGLRVVDERTLEITLSEPFTPFVKQLAVHLGGIVQKANVLELGDAWEDAPVCVGPYMLESWNRDTAEIVWVRNPHWWRTAPTIERVTHTRVEDGNTHTIMYENDEMDFYRPTDAVTGLLKLGESAAEMHLNPYGGTYVFTPKVPRAPMEDVNVRRALLKATDMGTIVNAIYQGTRTPAFGVYPATSEGFVEPSPYFDPEGARAALAASTYATADAVPPIVIGMPSEDPALIQIAEAMVQMWGDILGIEASVVPYAEGTDPITQTAQMGRTAHGEVWADPGSFATDMGLSSGIFMADLIEASDDEIDALVRQGNSLPLERQAERIEIYREVERLIMDRAYYIPIARVEVYYVVKPWVQGPFATNNDLSPYTLPELSIAER